jgi:serine-threonine kinase receptor-associated protein
MLRNGVSGDWIGSFIGHKGAVWEATLDSKGNLCATASGDFSAGLWDAITGARLATYGHKHIVKTVSFSPSSTHLATGGHEGILRVYDLANNNYTKDSPVYTMKLAAKANITKSVWLSDEVILTGDSAGNLTFWEVASGSAIRTLAVAGSVMDMEVSANLGIVTVSAGTTISFISLTNYGVIKAVECPTGQHFRDEGGTTLHPDGSKFVSGGGDLWVRVFDFSTGECIETNKGHHGPIRCVRYSPEGESYASGSEDGTIRLWRS